MVVSKNRLLNLERGIVRELEGGGGDGAVGGDGAAPREREWQACGAGVADGDIARGGVLFESEIDGAVLVRADVVGLQAAAQDGNARL